MMERGPADPRIICAAAMPPLCPRPAGSCVPSASGRQPFEEVKCQVLRITRIEHAIYMDDAFEAAIWMGAATLVLVTAMSPLLSSLLQIVCKAKQCPSETGIPMTRRSAEAQISARCFCVCCVQPLAVEIPDEEAGMKL